ncbi:MAG TPA: CRISPR-associated helicase Cas3' [Pyrinomonadaceae bacterium]
MSELSQDYVEFFRVAFADDPFGKDRDYQPFAYQRQLASLDDVPSLINVPTGAGKTAAIIGAWLWRRLNRPASVGRRLVYCLPMRTLVEQTRNVAKKAIESLSLQSRFRVHTLMGGETDSKWESEPERECIIIGTQDILLSRALNRGYAMSRYKWPVHFGLLNNDCLWVFDEVQLMGNGLATSAQLAAFKQEFQTAGQAHSLWMSATLKKDWLETIDWKEKAAGLEVVSLSEADRESAVLSARLKAVKILRKADEQCRLPKGLADFVRGKHQFGTQTLFVVNTVKRAREVYQELNKFYGKTDATQIELIHSRFRPAERKSWQKLFEDTSYTQGAGRIIVATQVVEAGVDISSRLLITDLAPFSSLVQRFGRCNRNGEHEQAEIFWIDRPTTKDKIAEKAELEDSDKQDVARPYDWRELEIAQELIKQLSSASPEDLEKVPYKELYRPTHVLRRRDLIDLFDTTPDLSGYDLDISRFVRDSDERDVSVAWRELKGEKPNEVEPRPSRNELCAVPIHQLTDFLKNTKIKAWTWDALEGEWIEVRPENLRAGVTILLDSKSGGYDSQLGWCGKDVKKPVPPIAEEERKSKPEEAYADDGWSFPDYAQTLTAHSLETRRMLEDILGALDLPDIERFKAEILAAAQHHDWGKAHKIFQQTLHGSETAEQDFSPLLAKSKSNRKHKRKKFRHELASALALLQTGASDLTIYLAACHHGKVRLSIRALPGEDRPKDIENKPINAKFARGIWDGDELPAADLGDGLLEEKVALDLEPMLLGTIEAGSRSWLERMIALRDELGIFRLAFLEALIRAADVRASMFPQDTLPSEDEAK